MDLLRAFLHDLAHLGDLVSSPEPRERARGWVVWITLAMLAFAATRLVTILLSD